MVCILETKIILIFLRNSNFFKHITITSTLQCIKITIEEFKQKYYTRAHDKLLDNKASTGQH